MVFANFLKKIKKTINPKTGAKICAKKEPATNSLPKTPESLPAACCSKPKILTLKKNWK